MNATHCDHCGRPLTVHDVPSLRVCFTCYVAVLERTERRGRYAGKEATRH